MHPGQVVQRLVKLLNIEVMVDAVFQDLVEGDPATSAGPLLGPPAPSVVDQDLPHGPSRAVQHAGGVRIRAEVVRGGQAEPGFVEQGGGLKGVVRTFAGHGPRGQPVKSRVQELEELV
jgi:hypothetical protein